MTYFDWGREAEKATEQAGFERGVAEGEHRRVAAFRRGIESTGAYEQGLADGIERGVQAERERSKAYLQERINHMERDLPMWHDRIVKRRELRKAINWLEAADPNPYAVPLHPNTMRDIAYRAGRAERDAETQSVLREMIELAQSAYDYHAVRTLQTALERLGGEVQSCLCPGIWDPRCPKHGADAQLAAARKVIEGYDGEVVLPKPSNALHGHIGGNQTSPASTKE